MGALHRKKPATTAVVPFNPEQIMQGESSTQSVKITMTLQVLSLFLQPLWKQAQPILLLLKMKGMAIPSSPEELISAVLLQNNDDLTRNSVLSVCEIMRAVVDEAVTPQAFEEILLTHMAVLQAVRVVEESKTA